MSAAAELLKDLDSRRASIAVAFFMGIVAPGFLTFFVLYEQLFRDLEFSKLLVISSAITSPTFMLLFVVTFVGERVVVAMKHIPPGRLGGFSDWFVTHCISNASIFYGGLLIHHLFDLTAHGFYVTLVWLFFFYFVMEFIRVIALPRSRDFNPIITDPNHPPVT